MSSGLSFVHGLKTHTVYNAARPTPRAFFLPPGAAESGSTVSKRVLWMGDETTTRRAAERFSRPPNDRSIRLCACLGEEDAVVLAALSFDGFIVSRATPDELAQVASARGAEVLVVDADLPGTLSSVARIRRSESVLSTLPIVLVGVRGASLRTGERRGEAWGRPPWLVMGL
jgi:hypothetical protein